MYLQVRGLLAVGSSPKEVCGLKLMLQGMVQGFHRNIRSTVSLVPTRGVVKKQCGTSARWVNSLGWLVKDRGP